MTEIVFRSVSALALVLMIVQFVFVAIYAIRRIKRGANGYTLAILYWAGASVVYSTNEILRVYMMSLDAYPYRGIIALVGSALSRLVMVAAIGYLLYVMKFKRENNAKV